MWSAALGAARFSRGKAGYVLGKALYNEKRGPICSLSRMETVVILFTHFNVLAL